MSASPSPRTFDLIVLGAGAAGLFLAAQAAIRGRRVALLEHNGQPGRKILISGGGRCNFTNIHCSPANFLSQNPHFAKSALAAFTPRHFLELVDRYRIPWHEKTLGQLFCDRSARDILNMLLAECQRGSVEIVLNAANIEVEHTSGQFAVSSDAGQFTSAALAVATGGLSIPTLGATGLGYKLARQFGLALVPTRPALVPLVLTGKESGWTALAGIGAEVDAYAAGHPKSRFREKMLVTHRGLSGPAILQASSYWEPNHELRVDLAPGRAILAPLLQSALAPPRRDAAALRQALREVFPQRLATFLADIAAPAGFTTAALEACEQQLHHWPFHPATTEGYAKAEVTRGGISTDALNARTMEARAISGLFFIGEVVDVTGHLGGFNFQWAWASAHAAARAL